jgi:predicted lipoprotein with Yx(FWY)xxD motif
MRVTSVRLLAVSALAALALAACGSSSKSSNVSATTIAPTPTTASPATTTGGTSTSSGTDTVKLASVKVKGEDKMVLVDQSGMTLYVWDKDKTAGKADCTGACAQAWPPLYVTGTPTYGSGLNMAMFSEVTGPNGSKQLAVNGKPLYRWAGDKKAGDATGDDVNSFYVVAATGQKIDQS